LNIVEHWLHGVDQCLSPNFDERPDCAIDFIVVHNISLPPGQFGGPHIAELFCNNLAPDQHSYFAEICHLQVSAHVLIDRCGSVTQFVGFDKRAWHAGLSSYRGRERFNDFSIGIELEGTDHVPYTDTQYQQLTALIDCLKRSYPDIDNANIVGHDAIAPNRKTDPGPAFEWQRLLSGLEQRSD